MIESQGTRSSILRILFVIFDIWLYFFIFKTFFVFSLKLNIFIIFLNALFIIIII